MDLADIGKPEEEEEGKSCEDKSINIDISLIMGKMGGKPHPNFGDKKDEEEGNDAEFPMEKACLPKSFDEDDDRTDWKSIAKQLIQAVSMMDTHTDGVNSGTEDPDGALKAIDNETSRILWGKQEEDNPRSSYQNANYGQTTANGMVMTNPAEVCNKDAYEEDEGEPKPFKHPTAPPSDKPASIPPSVIKQAEKEDDLFDAKHDDEDDDAEDMAEDKKEAAKGFHPKTNGFKKAAEGIIKKGKNKNKFDDLDEPDDLDDPDESDDQFDNKKMR